MMRGLAIAVLLALTAAWGAVAYQSAAREDDYHAALRAGDAALMGERTVEAIEAYSGAVALKPEAMLGHLRRGETYLQRGDLEAAARDFRAAAELDPSATRPLEKLGDVRYRQGRYPRAAELYEAHLRLDDRSAGVGYKLSLARFRAGQFERAIAALDRVLSLDDQRPDAHYLLGLCLVEKGRLLDGVRALVKAIELAPDLIPAREELTDAYDRLGRQADRLPHLQVLAALEGDRVERRITLGLALAAMGQVEPAVLTLRKALEQTTDHAAVYRAIGQVWLDVASDGADRTALSKAIEALERVVAAPGATSDLLTIFGRALLAASQTEAAERVLLQAMQRFPIDPSAFLEYAAAAERLGRWDAARDALIRHSALATSTSSARAAARAARIASLSLRANDFAGAIFWFERALKETPHDVALLTALADAQIRRGNRLGARTTIARGLDRHPDDEALLALSRRVHF